MKIPDKIYLQVCMECDHEDCENCKFEDLECNVTWCKERIFEGDKEYVSKDAILDLIMDKRFELRGNLPEFEAGMHSAYDLLIKTISDI